MHYLSTGIRAHSETHQFAITEFIAVLDPKLNKMVVRKYANARDNLTLLKLFFRWQNDVPRRCWRLILLIVVILSGCHPP